MLARAISSQQRQKSRQKEIGPFCACQLEKLLYTGACTAWCWLQNNVVVHMNSRCSATHRLAVAAWGSARTGVRACSFHTNGLGIPARHMHFHFHTHMQTHARTPQRFRHCVSGPELEFGRAHGCETVRHQRSNQKGSGARTRHTLGRSNPLMTDAYNSTAHGCRCCWSTRYQWCVG